MSYLAELIRNFSKLESLENKNFSHIFNVVSGHCMICLSPCHVLLRYVFDTGLVRFYSHLGQFLFNFLIFKF
jgi:hypothetical protein